MSIRGEEGLVLASLVINKRQTPRGGLRTKLVQQCSDHNTTRDDAICEMHIPPLYVTVGLPAYLLGTAFIGLGLSGLARPETQYPTYGLPSPPLPPSLPKDAIEERAASRAAASPFVKAKAVRDLALGLLYVAFQWRGEEGAVNTVMVTSVVIGVLDGAIVWVDGGIQMREKAWGHWGGTVFMGIYALSRIMGW